MKAVLYGWEPEGMESGGDEDEGWGGIILMYYLGNICQGPVPRKPKDPGFSDDGSLQPGAAEALGKAEIHSATL